MSTSVPVFEVLITETTPLTLVRDELPQPSAIELALQDDVVMVDGHAATLNGYERAALGTLLRNSGHYLDTRQIASDMVASGIPCRWENVSNTLHDLAAKTRTPDHKLIHRAVSRGRASVFMLDKSVVDIGDITHANVAPIRPAELRIEDPNWFRRSKCVDAPIEEMVPEEPDVTIERKAIDKYCANCDVVKDCLVSAIMTEGVDAYGARGGKTGNERERIQRARKAKLAGYVAATEMRQNADVIQFPEQTAASPERKPQIGMDAVPDIFEAGVIRAKIAAREKLAVAIEQTPIEEFAPSAFQYTRVLNELAELKSQLPLLHL